MSEEVELACRYAIEHAKKQRQAEISADDLLLGALRTISQFGIVELGGWDIDLEALGFDWLAVGDEKRHKVAYSQEVVYLLDHSARIARASGSAGVRVHDLLVAYANLEGGLMGRLKSEFRFSNAQWRAAIAALVTTSNQDSAASIQRMRTARVTEYLTPEEAAEILAIHVQTLRAHVRSGKLPALRLAGERAIRIRRADLERVFEPAAQAD